MCSTPPASPKRRRTRASLADGGGFDIAFEVPLYDFGKARAREAEEVYKQASTGSPRRRSMPDPSARRHTALRGNLRDCRPPLPQRDRAAPPNTISERDLAPLFNGMLVDVFAVLPMRTRDRKADSASGKHRGAARFLARGDRSEIPLIGRALPRRRSEAKAGPIVAGDAS